MLGLINLLRFIFLKQNPFGGDEESRTPDPLRARQVLSQLSYTPNFFSFLFFIILSPTGLVL